MDTRVELLLEELATMPRDQGFDFSHWRERYQNVLKEHLNEESRVILLHSYSVVLDFMERQLAENDGDVRAFRNARELDWRVLCIQEAIQRSGSDIFYPDDLNEIIQREVEAGRMVPSSYTELIKHTAKVMPGNPRNQEPRRGFWQRLFG